MHARWIAYTFPSVRRHALGQNANTWQELLDHEHAFQMEKNKNGVTYNIKDFLWCSSLTCFLLYAFYLLGGKHVLRERVSKRGLQCPAPKAKAWASEHPRERESLKSRTKVLVSSLPRMFARRKPSYHEVLTWRWTTYSLAGFLLLDLYLSPTRFLRIVETAPPSPARPTFRRFLLPWPPFTRFEYPFC